MAYFLFDDNGRLVETDHPLNILSGRAVGPLGTPGQVLAVAGDGQNLTWSNSGGTGTVTGSGASPQAAYWSTPTALAGDASFQYDQPNQHLVVGNVAVADVAGAFLASSRLISARSGGAAVSSSVSFSDTATDGGAFTGYHARGTSAAPTASQLGDSLFRFQGGGYYTSGGTGFTNPLARIDIVAAETLGAFAWGANMVFSTTQPGTTTLSQVLALSTDTSAFPGASVTGSTYITRSLMVGNASNQNAVPGSVSVSQTATVGGGPVLWTIAGAHTILAAESFDINFNLARTATFTHSSVPATQRAMVVQAPTYSNSTLTDTITTAATVAITGAPAAAGGITITNAYAFWVQAGVTTLAGGLNVGTGTGASGGNIIMSGQLRTGGAPAGVTGSINGMISDAGTNTVTNNLNLYHQTSSTAVAGFGAAQTVSADTNGGTNQLLAYEQYYWVDATDATRKGRRVMTIYDTVQRSVITLEGSGSAAMIGFLGANAIVRPSSTTDLRAALINLGLYTTGGASPLDLNGGALAAGTGTFSALLQGNAGIAAVITDASTNTQPTINQQYHHLSSGSPVAGFGSIFAFQADTTTTAQQNQAQLDAQWVVATHASRTARLSIYVNDNAGAPEVLRLEANGSAAGMIGVLGAAAVVRQTSGANLTNNVTAGGVDDQIKNYTGLTTYSTDAADIRNNIYQLARKLKQVNDAMRLYGWLT